MQKLNYLNYYALVEERPDDPAVLLEYARVIECEEGRQNIRVCDGPIPALVLRAHELDPSVDSLAETLRARPIFLGDATVKHSCSFYLSRFCILCEYEFHFAGKLAFAFAGP